MKGKYYGRMTVDELFQALYQDYKIFFRRHNITHVRGVYLYFTPCNEHGDELFIYDEAGNRIQGYDSGGHYQSAADAFEGKCFEPKVITRPRFDA